VTKPKEIHKSIMTDYEIDLTETVGFIEEDKVDPLNSGFSWWKAPMQLNTAHNVGGHTWTISGHDMQVLTTTVPAGEQVVTEQGSFMFMHPDMKMDVEFTLCQSGGLNRMWGGESCVKVLLQNNSSSEGYAGITPNYPAKIVPIVFGDNVKTDSALIAQGGSYMSEIGDVEVGCDADCSFKTCCCAGIGPCRQKITGGHDSVAFLAAGGTVVKRVLNDGETIIVDSASVVAYEDTVELGIASNGKFCTCCLGGEGCFSTTLTGPGSVWMQSMNFTKFRNAVQVTVYEEEMDRGEGGDSDE